MRDINLLPRKPFAEKAFRPLLALIGCLTLAIGGAVLYWHLSHDSDLQSLKEEISRMESHYKELSEARHPDPALADYQAYRDAVAMLDAGRRDWLPVLAEVTGLMPEASRTLEMSASGEGILRLSMEFSRWEDIVAYMIRLRGSPLMESVKVSSIAQTQKTVAEPAPENEANPAPEPPVRDELPAESAGGQALPSGDILDELMEIVTKEAEYQQFGRKSPDGGSRAKSGETAAGAESEAEDPFAGGGFEMEELLRARERLTQFKGTPPQEGPADSPDAAETKPKPEVYYPYLVLFELKAKAAADIQAGRGAGT